MSSARFESNFRPDDPQTLLGADSPGVIDVNANQAAPNTNTAGGVTEFQITNPVVALQGSGTADAPYLKLYIDTIGSQDVTVAYTIRDLDGSTDNAIQAVALQYRVGNSGDPASVPEQNSVPPECDVTHRPGFTARCAHSKVSGVAGEPTNSSVSRSGKENSCAGSMVKPAPSAVSPSGQ